MSDTPRPSDYLVDLIFMALDHGIDSIDDGAGPLVPFMLTDRDGERDIRRFVAEQLEDGVRQARLAARKETKTGKLAAIAYDGFLTTDGKRMDAIFVQAADSPDGPTFYFAQRYTMKGTKVEPFGNAAFVHIDQSLFPD